MLRHIRAHKCVYVECRPDYLNQLRDQICTEIETDFATSVTAETKLNIHEAAVKKYKSGAETAALGPIRTEIGAEITREFEYRLRAELEQSWTNDKRAEMKKEIIFSRLRWMLRKATIETRRRQLTDLEVIISNMVQAISREMAELRTLALYITQFITDCQSEGTKEDTAKPSLPYRIRTSSINSIYNQDSKPKKPTFTPVIPATPSFQQVINLGDQPTNDS